MYGAVTGTGMLLASLVFRRGRVLRGHIARSPVPQISVLLAGQADGIVNLLAGMLFTNLKSHLIGATAEGSSVGSCRGLAPPPQNTDRGCSANSLIFILDAYSSTLAAFRCNTGQQEVCTGNRNLFVPPAA